MNKLTKLVESIVESKVRIALEEGNKQNKAKKNERDIKSGRDILKKYRSDGVKTSDALRAGRQAARSKDTDITSDEASRLVPKTFTDPKTGKVNPGKVKFSREAEQGKLAWMGKDKFKKQLASRALRHRMGRKFPTRNTSPEYKAPKLP